MGQSRVVRKFDRRSTVREQWSAWLPQEKQQLFQAILNDLEVGYVILSVSLDDGFALCKQGKLQAAREQAIMFASLFDRFSYRLRSVLRSLKEHGRRYGTFATVAPLNLEWFRTEPARYLVRQHRLASRLTLRSQAHFFKKLKALDEMTTSLQKETRRVTGEIADGTTLRWRTRWAELEMLHDDLNTCFRELTVVLKSFFCVLPAEQLSTFDKLMRASGPVPSADIPARWDALLPKMASV